MQRRTFLLSSAALLCASAASVAQTAEFKIVGAGDGFEMLQAVAAAFTAANPGKTVTVPPSIGSVGGMTAVSTDKEVMARIARTLTDADKAQGLIATPLVRAPIAIFVHPSTGVSQLTAAQSVDIFSGKLRNWSEFGGKDLPIRLVRRQPTDSTLMALREAVPGWRDLEITERSKLALTTPEVFDTVRATEGAIGFGPFVKAADKDVTYLRINGIFPTDAANKAVSQVYLLHKASTVTDDAKAFLAFAATPKAREIMKSLGGIVD